MKTGKLLINPTQTYHSSSEENSYFLVKFLKITGKTEGKLCPQDKRLNELSLMNITHYFLY